MRLFHKDQDVELIVYNNEEVYWYDSGNWYKFEGDIDILIEELKG